MPQSTTSPVILIAGATGVIGGNVTAHFVREGVRTRGVTRQPPAQAEGWEPVSANLLDPAATRQAFKAAADTTRLVFAAYIEKLDPLEQIQVNVDLLRNTLDGLKAVGAPLEHVTMYQGNKFYGANLGRFKTPALEDDPRLATPNFYYHQEDLLRARAQADGFAWTIFRPEGVMGYAKGSPMNLLMVLATYTAISKKLGIPLRFPGPRAAYDDVYYQMSDAELVAQATLWAGGAPTAANQAFNLTNGDVIKWSHLFKAIAAHYDMPLEEPQEFNLASQMPMHGELWNEIVREHGLQPNMLGQLVDWRFGDMILNSTWDNISNTIKLRHAGFHGCFNTIDRTLALLDELAARKIIPAARSARS